MKRLLLVIGIVIILLAGFSIFAWAVDKTELVSLRGEFRRVYRNGDGTITRQYWINPIHFLNEDNQWEEIDRSIMEIAKDQNLKAEFEQDFASLTKEFDRDTKTGQYNMGMISHRFKMYFPRKLDDPIQFKYRDSILSMQPVNIQYIHQQEEKIKALIVPKNEISYTDVWYHADLKYEIDFNGVREYIILKDIDAERELSFFIKVKGFELRTMPTGEIGAYAYKDGELLFTFPRPIMWDSENVYCSDIHYELKRENNGYLLKIILDQDYINSPERAFPLTIDPDIVLARNYVDEMTYIDTDNPDSNYYSSARMEVGNYKVWNWWFWNHWERRRGIFRFNRLTADLGPVSDQVVVNQAKLYFNCSENETESTFTDVYKINYDAMDWEVTQVTWNTPWGDGGSSVIPTDEDTWVYIPEGESYPRTYVCYLSTEIVETWIHSNETLNKGLMLVDYYEDDELSTLKKFDNVSLELTLNEEIFIEANANVYPNTPQTIAFAAAAFSATGGSSIRYEWDFDINDGYYDGDTRQNPIFCYQIPGEHVFSVKAIDGDGHSRIYYGTVNVPALNIETFYGLTDPRRLRFVTKTNYNCTYDWDFGDGSPGYIGTEAYHQYVGEGTYRVRLTISNNLGVNPLVVEKNLYYYHPMIFVHGFGGDYPGWNQAYTYINQVMFEDDLQMKNFAQYDNLTGLAVHTIFNFDYYRDLATDTRLQFVGALGTDRMTVLSTSGNGSYGDQYNSLEHYYSEMLGNGVENVCAVTGFDKVDLIVHSMGGLVSRAYIKYFDGNSRVDRLLTIGTPNHGVANLEEFVGKLICQADWMRELEVREMAHNSDTFYNVLDPSNEMGWCELLNNDSQISVDGSSITGCLGNDTVGPTRYVTIAGRDNGHVDIPVADLIWEWIAPDDGVVESGSVGLRGINVDANLEYPGIHTSSVPGNKCDLQIIHQTPFIASLVNTWMRQDRLLNAVATKPAAWVEVENYSDGTVSKFVVHTGANKDNAIWTWAMLQHNEEVMDSGGNAEFYFSFKDYNSFWEDLSNQLSPNEVIIDLSPAHYLPGDNLRVAVVTYDTQGCKVEYIPVQL